VKNELKMKPLLVSLNYPPQQLSHRGAYNISNMIKLGSQCSSKDIVEDPWNDRDGRLAAYNTSQEL
jgi:hypothetical protein